LIDIEIKDLKPGMKLMKDVVLPDGRLLLLAGFIIKPLYIRKLETFNVKKVFVDDTILECTQESAEEYNEEKLYKEATSTIKRVFTYVRNGRNIDLAAVENTVGDIVRKVISNETVMMQLTGIRDIDNYTFLHSVDVCIYSTIMGKKLGFSNQQLLELGMGAILHDIGKCKVSLDILQKPGKLTEAEFNIMKLHTSYGSEIIKSAYGLDTKISNIAYHIYRHHAEHINILEKYVFDQRTVASLDAFRP
jgi:HD-GYP domain-containing protein (c-di-GMP phosphodiesterase class II)